MSARREIGSKAPIRAFWTTLAIVILLVGFVAGSIFMASAKSANAQDGDPTVGNMTQQELVDLIVATFMQLMGQQPTVSVPATGALPMPPEANVTNGALPMPGETMPLLKTSDFVVWFLAWRNADTSQCHSQPFDFMSAMLSVQDDYQTESADGSTESVIRNPGPSGVGVLVADFTSGKTPKLASSGEFLYRDRQDKLVWLYTNEDTGIFTVHDSIVMPAGVSWTMFRLDGTLDHKTAFASFWGNGEETCNTGDTRAFERQLDYTGEAAAVTMSSVLEFRNSTRSLEGDAFLARANEYAEMFDGKNRVTQTGTYTLARNTCVAVWGTPSFAVVDGGGMSEDWKTGDGWKSVIYCASIGDPLILSFPDGHSGVLLFND
ncbi:MAG: hypothetical protein UU81_C0005G0015 [Microgenomates group bacterium GW2011_GWC1_41_8]|uniref:Uncharacterized protein n=2 Tax=Candidatus Roizmaniibacteriota TaxID=1752723 RepID=A0A0G0XAN0_9BACT|nr:MAG: hypothetical protein UU41_C0025G0011 [Candidatus Roizmanbacteria bacterium GW2011_GWA1_41_13]KKS21442.1 MAG: hypothetical protein UU78_C0038G0002 [Candidatus Roizmanbacteria bacterium GW2011_GWC2_41_7]KKS24557.1 MAG: hypothetical protein UU81_C0005G0015 [Microgenomates group bacterium GW2011_GWC1_41_8]